MLLLPLDLQRPLADGSSKKDHWASQAAFDVLKNPPGCDWDRLNRPGTMGLSFNWVIPGPQPFLRPIRGEKIDTESTKSAIISLLSESDRQRKKLGPIKTLVAAALRGQGINKESIGFETLVETPGSYKEEALVWTVADWSAGEPATAIEIKDLTDLKDSPKNTFAAIDNLVVRGLEMARSYGTAGSEGPQKPHTGAILLVNLDSLLDKVQKFCHRALDDGLYDSICLVAVIPYHASGSPYCGFPDGRFSPEEFVDKIQSKLKDRNESVPQGKSISQRYFRWLSTPKRDARGNTLNLTQSISNFEAGQLGSIERRRALLTDLRTLVENSTTTELEIQKKIETEHWLFGGRYVRVLPRRGLFPLDEHDIPLICSDNSIKVVELKRPDHPLVERHRNHWRTSNEVHEAVEQTKNYLRTIDETGAALAETYRDEVGIEFDHRRASGMVVIGHPDQTIRSKGCTRKNIDQTIRRFNSESPRVEVISYEELITNAEQMLRFDDVPGEDPPESQGAY